MAEYKLTWDDSGIVMRARCLLSLWLAGRGVVWWQAHPDMGRQLESLYAKEDLIRTLIQYIGSENAWGLLKPPGEPLRALRQYEGNWWLRDLKNRMRPRQTPEKGRRRRGRR
jgi:hypothetical protein